MNWRELRDKVLGKPEAIKAYRDAKADLEACGERDVAEYGWGNCPETDEYLEPNSRVIEAERNIPYWRRW
jgi:hypothetical protein